MNRRVMLTVTSIALSSLVTGCVFRPDSTDNGNDTAKTDSDEEQGNTEEGVSSSDPGEQTGTKEMRDINIVLRNVTSTGYRGSLTLSTDTKILIKQDFEIDGGDQQSIDSEITKAGQYELSVSTGAGIETTYPFNIEAYDLREGSDLIVEIDKDDIMVLLQE